MNRKNIFISLCLLTLLAACSNDELEGGQHPSPAPGPGEPDVVLNVGETVENFDELVAGLRTAKVIRIVTPDFTRVVDSQGVSEFLKSSDSEFLDLDNDSLRISLTDDYVTLSSDLITEKNAKAPSTQYYLVHKSKEYISEYRAVLRDQQAKFAATRTGVDEIPEIEQHSDYAISISNGQFVQQDDPVQPRLAKNSVLEWKETEAAQTRSTIATFPRPSDLLRIWLLRHSGYKAFQHEIDWQVNDVKLMIKDLIHSVRVEVHTRHTDFWASNDGFDTLYRFQKYVRDNADKGWQWSPSVGKDIFIVVSYGGYGGVVAGLGKLDVYKIRRQQNPEAFGLSGINPITCVKTLAHELGHILGAGHSNHSWWDGWWIFKFKYYDIMSYNIFRTPFIRDPEYRTHVQQNLWPY